METINAEILAYLLKIDKADANKKIVAYLEREKGNNGDYIEVLIGKHKTKEIPEDEKEWKKPRYEENESCDVAGLSKHINVDLEWAIKNIRDNYLNSPTTRGWIMNFPSSKLVVNKITRKMPQKVSIPKILRELLTEEDKKKIIQMWEDKYYTSVAADPINDVRFTIK